MALKIYCVPGIGLNPVPRVIQLIPVMALREIFCYWVTWFFAHTHTYLRVGKLRPKGCR